MSNNWMIYGHFYYELLKRRKRRWKKISNHNLIGMINTLIIMSNVTLCRCAEFQKYLWLGTRFLPPLASPTPCHLAVLLISQLPECDAVFAFGQPPQTEVKRSIINYDERRKTHGTIATLLFGRGGVYYHSSQWSVEQHITYLERLNKNNNSLNGIRVYKKHNFIFSNYSKWH